MRTLTFVKNLLLIAALAVAAPALGADDVGLVNQVTGDASYASGSSRAKASAYMKVREGDRFVLAPGAELRLVYFDGGRQESFSGPARFTAGKRASSMQSGAQPRVSTLPTGVSQRIAQTPELLAIAKLGRAGGVSVRSGARIKPLTPEQQAEIAQARADYERLRQASPYDDIMPEFFLLSVLDEHRQYQEMKPVVAEMQRRLPGSPEVAAMAEYVEAKSQGQ